MGWLPSGSPARFFFEGEYVKNGPQGEIQMPQMFFVIELKGKSG